MSSKIGAARWLAVLLLTILAACGRPDGKWIIDRIDDSPANSPRGVLRADLDDGSLDVQTGCNGLTGRYVAFAGHVWIFKLSQHLTVCRPGRVMEVEDLLDDRFAHASTFERGPDGALVLRTRAGQSITLRARRS